MFFVHHRAAKPFAPQSRRINHAPSLQFMGVIILTGAGKPGRIAEGRACGSVLGGLARIAFCKLVLHGLCKRRRIAPWTLEGGFDQDPSFGQIAVAIGKAQVFG